MQADLIVNREEFWKHTKYQLQGEDEDPNGRKSWFARIVALYKPKSVLELGCNEGSNLRRIHNIDPNITLAGLDINADAVAQAQATLPGARIVCGSIYEADKYFGAKEFDLVFSMGVLIHIPPEALTKVRDQFLRLSKGIVLHCEEHSENPRPMRFDSGVAHRWAHNYSELYAGHTLSIYPDVVGSADGAHQLAILKLGEQLGLLGRIQLWYLCRFLPFKDKLVSRLRVRWSVRGFPRFFFHKKS